MPSQWKLPSQYADKKQVEHIKGKGMDLGEEIGLKGTGAAGGLLMPVTIVAVFENSFLVADLNQGDFMEFSRAHGFRIEPPMGWSAWFVDKMDLSEINGAWKTRHPGDYVAC